MRQIKREKTLNEIQLFAKAPDSQTKKREDYSLQLHPPPPRAPPRRVEHLPHLLGGEHPTVGPALLTHLPSGHGFHLASILLTAPPTYQWGAPHRGVLPTHQAGRDQFP